MTFNEDANALLADYQNFISSNLDTSSLDRSDAKISRIIHYNDLNAVRQRISNWVAARLTARHVYVPDWTDLIRVYDYVIIDCHVTGIINGIKQRIKAKEWVIKNASGVTDDELTKQLKTRWFSRYMDWFVEAMFFPYSLIELGDYKDNRFSDIKLIEREYVVPQWKSVKMYLGGAAVPGFNTHTSSFGTILDEPRQERGNFLLEHFESPDRINDYIFVENPIHDLGLLDMASPHALGKMGSLTFFLDYLQKFVVPFRVGKTDINDNPRRNNMVAMMENWGASGYAVTDLEDVIESLSQGGTAVAPFTELFKYSNNEISKAFVSAVGIFDEKNFVGSAEAGERMMDYIITAYCTELEYSVNDELIPRLAQRDRKYARKTFEFATKEVISFTARVDAVTKLATSFDLDPEEVGEKVDMKISKKEMPAQLPGAQPQSTREKVVEKKEELKVQNIYPAEMVENAERALKYLGISKKTSTYTPFAELIISNTYPDLTTLRDISNMVDNIEPYTKSMESVEFDLSGGKAGKEWAIEQLKRK